MKEQFFDFYFDEEYNCLINQHNEYSDHNGCLQGSFWKNLHAALVHFVETPCKIKDFNKIVNHDRKSIEVSSGLRFIEIVTPSVEDARRRASVFAYLTYNFKNQTFMKVFTSENLADAFFLSNIRSI